MKNIERALSPLSQDSPADPDGAPDSPVNARVTQWAQAWAELLRKSLQSTAVPAVQEALPKQPSAEAAILPAPAKTLKP